MSIRWMQQVWQHSRANGNGLLLLLAVADCANDEDGIAWPSVPFLARRLRTSERQAYRIIAAGVASGELRVVGGGRGRANRYRLHLSTPDIAMSPLSQMSPLSPASQTPDIHDRGTPDIAVSPTPDIAMSPEPSGTIKRNRQEPSGRRGWRQVPPDATLTPARLEAARRIGLDAGWAEREWAKFRDHDFAAPRRDVDRTWANWCRTAAEKGPPRLAGKPVTPEPTYRDLRAVLAEREAKKVTTA